jgi:YD repeat-containing protein
VALTFGNPGLRLDVVRTTSSGGLQRQNDLVAPSPLGDSRTADSARTWFTADVGGPGGAPDGRSDVVVVDDRAGVVTTFLAQANGTWSVTRAFTLPAPRAAEAWLPADVDGDGRTDLVRATPSSVAGVPGVSILVMFATGTGTWRSAQSVAFAGSTVPRLSAFRVLDLDGDGRADLAHVDVVPMQAGNPMLTIRTLRSLGDGTFTARTQSLAQLLPDGDRYAVADVNGDGRADLARVDVHSRFAANATVLLGIGNGTFVAPATVAISDALDPTLDLQRGLRAADLDDDGRTDFYVVLRTPDSAGVLAAALQVVWNRSTGWASQVTRLADLTGADTAAFQLDDAEGDGRPDLVRLGASLDRILLGAPSKRMTVASNGLGGEERITYTTSTGSAINFPIGMVLPLVMRVTLHDRGGGQLDATGYSYAGLRYDYGLAQVLGAATTTAVTARATVTTSYQLDDRCGARPTVIELRDQRGALITRTTRGFVPASTSGAAPYECLDATVTREECEGAPSCRTTNTRLDYDAYGNVAERWEEGDVTDASDDRLTTSPASPNLAAWIVSRPAYRAVFAAGSAGWAMAEYTETLYDGGPDWKTPPIQGLPTAIRRWNDQTGGFVVETKTYDTWGNPTLAMGPPTSHAPSGAFHKTTYDCTFHRFPIEQCDAVGCSSTTWDETLSLPRTTTDANGAVTRHTYDTLARLVRTDLPDGSAQTWTPPDWTANEPSLRSARTDASPVDGVLWIDTFFDGLGRTRSTREEGGRQTDLEYDGASPRVARRSNPYLPGTPVSWTTVTFDAADRPTRIVNSGNTARQSSYHVGVRP